MKISIDDQNNNIIGLDDKNIPERAIKRRCFPLSGVLDAC